MKINNFCDLFKNKVVVVLNQLLSKEIFHSIDVQFASHFEERFKILLATLMRASRQGHLCFNPHTFFYESEDATLEKAWKEEVCRVLQYPVDSLLPHVIEEEGFFYLQKNWAHENKLAYHVERVLQFSLPPLCKSPPASLNEEQRKAYLSALSHPLSVITGGPGTGKTFVVRHIVEAMPEGSKIFLAAPTGKAAARLKEMNPEIVCTTLHALLGIRSSKDLHHTKKGYLKADLVIVDECSMVDVQLFSYLLSSLQPGTRLVLIGDPDQLPPVESGTVFADLVGLIPTATLNFCMRSDRKPLLDLAASVRRGEAWSSALLSLEEVEKTWTLSYPHPSFEEPSTSISMPSFRLLSTIREGPMGVVQINERIACEILRSLKRGQFLQIPILLRKTDPLLGLNNGEIGLLVRDFEKPLYALFGNKKIPAALIPKYDLAYCLSVHQSQGSEFDEVILFVPPGSEVFGRELLYTGITRAKHQVKIVGSLETLQKTVVREGRKISRLRAKVKL